MREGADGGGSRDGASAGPVERSALAQPAYDVFFAANVRAWKFVAMA